MRKSIILLCTVALLASCENKKQQEDLANAQALAAATHEELVQAVQERDQLLDLVNEITSTTEEIKDMEDVVAIRMTSGESVTPSEQISANIDAIKATMEQRRQKLAELEASLAKSKASNSKLLTTIENLKTQIASQAEEINSLTTKLHLANERIAQLGGKVDSLNVAVNSVTSERDSVQLEANRQEALANACYYAIGSKSELKANGIVEGGGFLKKSKINTSNLNKSFFQRADKRTLRIIPLNSTKAKVITTFQPKGSYEIIDVDGQKVLQINNPEQFWGVSDYLVIQID